MTRIFSAGRDPRECVDCGHVAAAHVEIRTAAGWERWDWPCATYADALACARDVSRVWGFACRVVRS